ncbi:dihydroxyacetone kinase subunit L [Modestobacter muralis]|uniref:Dihydroxyacetone kinase subunit L n=1 Tax=Modestobacter muralis TaxID=1608614 RepID=A0A6P0H304_9ACTN|nr:dihydroxyacetone kinase subunit DhaL [Modestobacter muralis]NEK92798.1 dihydroxyacetone kinase subunit L [Modestobacter muralis]NEN49565.1 dihydroxyacetone kinase subunit L [Modestobacter muralis]
MTATLDRAAARRWMDAFAADFETQRVRLTELDRAAGDGDFGANLRSALGKVQQRLAADPQTARAVFAAVSDAFLDTGGTSGPLFGMWFRALSRALPETDPADVTQLAEGVREGTATVQRLGGAEVGDKTMVDAMVPAVAALTDATGTGPQQALTAAAEAAEAGAASTEDLVARRGRASYVGEVARGVLDPGALAVALFFRAGARALDG